MVEKCASCGQLEKRILNLKSEVIELSSEKIRNSQLQSNRVMENDLIMSLNLLEKITNENPKYKEEFSEISKILQKIDKTCFHFFSPVCSMES